MKVLTVPYFRQLDNKSGQGYRECLSSSCAMLAAHRGKVSGDDEYNDIRRRYGDTTNIQAQLKALESLGLKARFYTTGSERWIKSYIDAGIPMACGWLHKGPVSRPSGGGHWSVLIGYGDAFTVHHDPYGEANLTNGGYVNYYNGNAIRYSYKNWMPRWSPEGTGHGWYIVCL